MQPKLLIILAVFLWSTAFVAIRLALKDYAPGSIALFRFFLAGMCFLVPFFRLPSRAKLSRKQLLLILLIGPLGIAGYSVLLNQSEIHIAAGIACFVVSLSPLFSSLLAVLLLGEKVSPRLFTGFGISLVGLFLIGCSDVQNIHYNLSLLLLLIAVLFGSIQSAAQKKLVQSLRSLEVVTWSTWLGILLLCIYLPDLKQDFQQASWTGTLSCIYLGLVPSFFAQWFWTESLSKVPLVQANTFLFAMPILTTVIGYLTLGEIPHPFALAGGLVALFGAYVSVRQPSKPITNPACIDSRD